MTVRLTVAGTTARTVAMGNAATKRMPSGRVSAASAARIPAATAILESSSRPDTAARARTAAIAITTSANSPFSKPLVVQMTNDGTAAVTVPAARVMATGRRDTVRAIENMRANTPKQHSSATILGYSTTSGTPNHEPWSNRRSTRPRTNTANQVGFEKPSTGTEPACNTGPAPVASERA